MADVPVLLWHDFARPFGRFQVNLNAQGVAEIYKRLESGDYKLEPKFIETEHGIALLEVSIVPNRPPAPRHIPEAGSGERAD